jgi:hypothetical protein
LGLPTAARRMCAITSQSPVLLVACPARGVLMIHPTFVVARLLAELYTNLKAGADGG